MSNVTYEQFLHLVRAGAGVVHIASYEWQRVRGWCIGLSRELDLPLQIWSSSSGLVDCDANGKIKPGEVESSDPIQVMKDLRESDRGGVILMEDIHPYLEREHHEVTRWVREMCRQAETPRRLVVLSTPQPGLPPEIRKEVPTIELPLPDVDDLETVAEDVAESLGVTLSRDPALFEAARGLTVMEARLAFGQAAVQLDRLDHSAVGLVVREKERVIKQSGVLEYYEPDARMNEVGGLENLKSWLERRGLAFGPGAREFGLDSPKGVLLLGVQGCGKSLVAKAIAASWQFPLLRFDMGKVFGGIVGQSEGNMRTALQVAQALAPCVLWIDEIEKGLAGIGSSDQTDGGTTARVVGTFLTWMQEKNEPVFVVATANRIGMLPPELLRKGRFDEIFFVDLPAASVRRDIFAIHLTKRGRKPSDFDLERLAQVSVGYSGAEIEEAIREGLFDAFSDTDTPDLSTKHIESALEATFPLSRTMADQIRDLRGWARVRARLAAQDEPEPVPKAGSSDTPQLRQEVRNPFIPGEERER